jgi:2-polyprenyl-3-methyl-5-hydroxy-6-metoxy-1,4-benzoquinol methylase
MNKSTAILSSWEVNAGNWISTIDNEEIESRRLATNAAIIQAILEYHKGTIIDIGCGEGWLTRELQQKGVNARGVDAVESLVENATQKGGPYYSIGSYGTIAAGAIFPSHSFDSAVINFALLDKDDTAHLISYLPTLLKIGGYIFIQTLHPFAMLATDDYETGWKDGSWKGLKQDFVQPYQWYFRTLQDWVQLFSSAGLTLIAIKEPIHPESKKPLSIIFILRVP